LSMYRGKGVEGGGLGGKLCPPQRPPPLPTWKSAVLTGFFRRRPTYTLSSRNVTAIPSAARHSEMLFRLWPLSRAALISGQRFRIRAAFVGGFFSRNAARRGRGFLRIKVNLPGGGTKRNKSKKKKKKEKLVQKKKNIER